MVPAVGSQSPNHGTAREVLTVVLLFPSLIINSVEHIFMCLLAICMFYLEKYLFRPIFHWVILLLLLSYRSCLSILEIKSLSVSSANIFSHSVSCLFILFMISFAVQMIISLTWSPF